MTRALLARLGFFLLRSAGYRLDDIWDSWKLVLANSDKSDEHSLRRRLYAFLMISQLKELIGSRSVDLVIDVGAFQGEFTRKIRQLGYSGRMLSVEPNPERLASLMQLSSKDALWHVSNKAAGLEYKSVELSIPTDSSFASTVSFTTEAERIFGNLTQASRKYTVEQLPLSRILREADGFAHFEPRSILLKCDTQGVDRDAVASLGEMISVVRVLMVEVPCIALYGGTGNLSDNNSYYESLGFKIAGAYPVSWSGSDEVVEFDLVYVR